MDGHQTVPYRPGAFFEEVNCLVVFPTHFNPFCQFGGALNEWLTRLGKLNSSVSYKYSFNWTRRKFLQGRSTYYPNETASDNPLIIKLELSSDVHPLPGHTTTKFPVCTKAGGGGEGSPLFWVKKEEMTKERRAGWASKIEPYLPLSSKSGSATGTCSVSTKNQTLFLLFV